MKNAEIRVTKLMDTYAWGADLETGESVMISGHLLEAGLVPSIEGAVVRLKVEHSQEYGRGKAVALADPSPNPFAPETLREEETPAVIEDHVRDRLTALREIRNAAKKAAQTADAEIDAIIEKFGKPEGWHRTTL